MEILLKIKSLYVCSFILELNEEKFVKNLKILCLYNKYEVFYLHYSNFKSSKIQFQTGNLLLVFNKTIKLTTISS